MSPQPTVFLEEQQIWIILKYGEVQSTIKVRRAFRLKYHKSYPVSVPHEMAFKRVVEKFKGNGDVSNPKSLKRDESKVPTHDVEAIEAYFLQQPEAHLRDAVRDLGFCLG